jgi:hypothetical protein
MNEHKENYCTGKGLTLAMTIIVFLLVGVPVIISKMMGAI